MTKTTERDPDAVRTGANIRTRRDELGLGVGELAAAIGKSHSYVSNIEHGRKKCPPKLLPAIAAALDTTPDEILNPASCVSCGRSL